MNLTPALIRATHARVRAEKARRSLAEFVRQAWPIVEPAMPLAWGWHVDAICGHLEAVTRGDVERLCINIPPGHAKSILVSVMWPAWEWSTTPAERSLFASYSDGLAVRDSVRCRDLVESEWYVRSFRTDLEGRRTWNMKGDSNAKDWFQNDRTGFRVSLTVGGASTGHRGNKVAVDDPHNVRTASSALEREAVIRWWDVAMSSRFNDMRAQKRVIIMQRLHEGDLTGHVLAQGGYEHLCLPSLYEPKRRCRTFKVGGALLFEDPRTREGSPLFPALFTPAVLEQALADLKETEFAAQHQQRPVPAGGGLFKKAWWRFWKPSGTKEQGAHPRPDGTYTGPARELPERFDRTVISLDANFKGDRKKGNDPVVFVVIGCKGADRFVLDRVRLFVGFGETVTQFRTLSKLHPKAFRKLVEAKANGDAIIETLQSEIGGIVAVTPEGGKESRASAIAPQVEGGNVYLPDGAPWLDEWVAEFASFPRGAHDDQVDALSQALIDLTTNNGADRFRALAAR